MSISPQTPQRNWKHNIAKHPFLPEVASLTHFSTTLFFTPIPRFPASSSFDLFKLSFIQGLLATQQQTSSVYSAFDTFRVGDEVLTVAAIYVEDQNRFVMVEGVLKAKSTDVTSFEAAPLHLMACQTSDPVVYTALWNLGRTSKTRSALLNFKRGCDGSKIGLHIDGAHLALQHDTEAFLDVAMVEGFITTELIASYKDKLLQAMRKLMSLWAIAVNSMLDSLDEDARTLYLRYHLQYLMSLVKFEDDLLRQFTGEGYTKTRQVMGMFPSLENHFATQNFEEILQFSEVFAHAMTLWDLRSYQFKVNEPHRQESWQKEYHSGITPHRLNLCASVTPALIPNYMPSAILVEAMQALDKGVVRFDLPERMKPGILLQYAHGILLNKM